MLAVTHWSEGPGTDPGTATAAMRTSAERKPKAPVQTAPALTPEERLKKLQATMDLAFAEMERSLHVKRCARAAAEKLNRNLDNVEQAA